MTVPKRSKRANPDPELVKLADSLLTNYKKPEDLIGLLKQLTKMLVERALEAEMSEHLGHDKSQAITNASGNARNGHSGKTPFNITLQIDNSWHPRARRAGFGDRGRAAGEDDAPGRKRPQGCFVHVPRMDIAVDAQLAHASGDQLAWANSRMWAR